MVSTLGPRPPALVIRYHARWVVPITAPPVERGSVAVEGARIAYVGPRAGAPPGADVELGEAILLPGLVNAHTHLELTAMRGFLEELEFPRWVATLTRARSLVLTGEALLDSARLGIDEGLRAGVTTFADTSESGAPLRAMTERGVRGIVYQEVFGPDPAQCEEAVAGLRARVAALRADETPLARVGVSPHAPYSVSDDLFAAVAHYACAEGLPVAVHAAESEAETLYVRDAAGPWGESHRRRGIAVAPRGRSTVAMLERTGVLRARPLLIHCVRTDAEDVRLIADSRSSIAHCPVSNAKLGHGVAPLAEWLDAAVPVGLGSDSVASNNRMDLLAEARAAVALQRARLGRGDVLPAATALELATLGGARALGLDAEIGSLEAGKQADLAAFSIDGPEGTQAADPATIAVWALAGNRAQFAAVAGRVLVRDGRPVAEDPALVARVRHIAARLAEWRATDGESGPGARESNVRDEERRGGSGVAGVP